MIWYIIPYDGTAESYTLKIVMDYLPGFVVSASFRSVLSVVSILVEVGLSLGFPIESRLLSFAVLWSLSQLVIIKHSAKAKMLSIDFLIIF